MHCSAHGCRKAGAKTAAENGATADEGRVVESEASPQAKLDFLADAVRKALRHLDAMSPKELAEYLQAATGEAPPFWAKVILQMHDELRPALNILGLDYHRE